MRRVLLMALLVASLAGLAVADGPETGVVTGKVSDANGQALPGVTVTLTGDRGSDTAITDGDGVYRFALLPPGSYEVKAELEGFRAATGVVAASAGGKAEVNLKLTLETAETITVTSEAPLVDKYNVSVGGSVEAETTAEVSAVNRGIYGAINLLPGVTNDQESLDLSSSRPSFNGTSWIESSVFIDGVDTSFTRYGGTRMFLPSSATSEISLSAGGSGADYGRVVGGVTNVIVKSGTNKFHGEATGVHRNLAWDGNFDEHLEYETHPNRPRLRDHFVYKAGERDKKQTSYEASLGGPLLRDKAWFFVATSEWSTFTRDKTVGSPSAPGACGIEEQRSGACVVQSDLIDQSTDVESFVAKFNLQPSARHQVAVSWIATPVERLFQLTNMADRYVPTLHDLGGSLTSATWNASLSKQMFLETKVAAHTSNEDKILNAGDGRSIESALAEKQADPRFAPVPGLTSPEAPVNNFDVYVDNADGTWHNGWLLDNGFGTNEYPRDQFNSALTLFTNKNHEFRFGVDWQQTEWDQDVEHNDLFNGTGFDAFDPFGFASPVAKRDYHPADVVAEGKGSGRSLSENIALYARDRFSVGERWTFNLGLRVEDQTHKNDIDRTVIDSTDISPRITAVYDVNANGKMLLTGSAGRYHTHIPQEMINSFLLDDWNGFNAYDLLFFVRAFGGYVFNIGGIRPGRLWEFEDAGLVDIDIEPYGRDEAILGFEWQFSKRWAFNTKAIFWETFDQIGNTTQLDPLSGSLFLLSENLKDYPSVLRSLGWVDAFVADGRGTAEDAERILDGFDEGTREYTGLQLQLNRRFGNGWALYNNITFAKTEGSTFGASAFNNTNDSYGELLHLVLTEDDIGVPPGTIPDDPTTGFNEFEVGTGCIRRNNTTRSTPVDCEALRPFLGMPLSVINRFGEANRERPVIFKSYGFKVWNFGKHSFNLGGLLNVESGVRWSFTQTGEEEANNQGNFALDDSVTLYAEERGTRRISGRWWLNLSGAWNFPLGWDQLSGELRLEVTNVTSEQDLVGVGANTGVPSSSRRSFSQPRKFRLLGTVRF